MARRDRRPNDGWLRTEDFREVVATECPTPTHKLVLFVLAARQHEQPPLAQLATEVGVSLSRLKTVLADMRKAGLIVPVNRGRRTTYRVLLGEQRFIPAAGPKGTVGSTRPAQPVLLAVPVAEKPRPKKRHLLLNLPPIEETDD